MPAGGSGNLRIAFVLVLEMQWSFEPQALRWFTVDYAAADADDENDSACKDFGFPSVAASR